jgi:Ca-activated chloride channel family protein
MLGLHDHRLYVLSILALTLGGCFYADSGGYGGEGDYAGDGSVDEGGEPVPPPAPERPEQAAEPSPECNATDDVTLYLSPDDSNSMSSPVQARENVLGSGEVGSIAIRPWEFMNYYTFDYPAAEAGTVRVTPSLRVAEGAAEGEYTLQIAVSSEHVAPEERAPLNVTLVLDTSGSMEGHAMDMLKASCHAIAGNLAEGDVVSMVTWDTDNQVRLSGHAVAGPADADLLAAIDGLAASGGTDLHAGLVAGYDLAMEAYDKNRINRIVLVSDGGANVGVTDIDTIAMHANSNDSEGIYMVGVGVSSDQSYYEDDLMDAVTDAGKGAAVYIDDAAEVQRVFGDDFVSTLDVAVRDVQVRLDLPPGFSVVRFSGEEISSNPEEVEPQHLAPNDAMVFHQDIKTCAPEQVLDDTTFTVAVSYLDGTTFQSGEVELEVSFAELLQAEDPLLLKGAAVFAYAEALRGAQKGDEGSALARAFAALEKAEAVLDGDSELAEIRQVLEAL